MTIDIAYSYYCSTCHNFKSYLQEIIDYLKDPALLRLRGISRIGGVLLAGAPGTGSERARPP